MDFPLPPKDHTDTLESYGFPLRNSWMRSWLFRAKRLLEAKNLIVFDNPRFYVFTVRPPHCWPHWCLSGLAVWGWGPYLVKWVKTVEAKNSALLQTFILSECCTKLIIDDQTLNQSKSFRCHWSISAFAVPPGCILEPNRKHSIGAKWHFVTDRTQYITLGFQITKWVTNQILFY